MSLGPFVLRLLEEPPFRLVVRKIVEALPFSSSTKAHWDAVPKSPYLNGMLAAAVLAKGDGIHSISCIEFGVAGGAGLLAMQRHARMISRELGIKIEVYGFDTGKGMPQPVDYRDHPGAWIAGDYPMDQDELRKRLDANTRLMLGNVRDTLRRFDPAPIGFISFDLDYYSSTVDAFEVFKAPHLRMVFLYFDDICLPWSHQFAGERLAIDEFNRQQADIKIDLWHDLTTVHRPFFDSGWLRQMYVAHDLQRVPPQRMSIESLPLIPAKNLSAQ